MGADETTAAGDNTQPLKVLCVDDNDMVLKALVRLLRSMGCVVTSATTGEQAWHALQAAAHDLLLTDHDLPGMSGTELAVKIRHHGMRLPIIVMSGAPAWQVGLDEAQVPNAAYLEKPFGSVEMVRTFHQLQGRR